MIIHGKGISSGTAIGTVRCFQRGSISVAKVSEKDPETETQRFRAACQTAGEQLDALQSAAASEIGSENSLVFEIHRMMLEDDDFCDAVTDRIQSEGVTAEYAAEATGEAFAAMFFAMDDPYMRERSSDVRDIARRLLRILTGTEELRFSPDAPYILVSDDLTPSETAQLERSKLLAIATSGGTATSHTAIFARTMGIPTVVGAGDALGSWCEGKTAIVDGTEGTIHIDPDSEVLQAAEQRQHGEKERRSLLENYRGKPSVSRSGRKIELCTNIGSLADADIALQNDAEGVGLFRSEFLYLESDDFPTEEQQFAAYKAVAEKFGSRRVVIRTLDIGADKQIPYLTQPKEENPALGLRAIRLCLAKPELFRAQLRAIYRASAFGNLAIMFPMVNSLEDVYRVRQEASLVRSELTEEGIPFTPSVELGIMIETPAAAIISDILAKEVDFFSIGTNDLTQYTLAVDRQNPSLAPFCDIHHEALLRLIRFSAENAHKNGIWIGICGELGSDESLTEHFLAMGIDELSVSPSSILPLRAKVCQSE